MRRRFPLVVLLSAIALSACGTRGALYLPPPRKAQPTTAPTIEPGKTTTSPDVSTAKDSAS
ncbi:LPS translocon maturation chaperone LptM [Propionivibrio soli]|uniref:LPS translocon maturation chaperone LptM n=1 Tax=Propionivibrio soli TaxID=2976531 RepID=UPI003B848F9E